MKISINPSILSQREKQEAKVNYIHNPANKIKLIHSKTEDKDETKKHY